MSGDHSGRTPLHVASASGQIGMVQWLLEKGLPCREKIRINRKLIGTPVGGGWGKELTRPNKEKDDHYYVFRSECAHEGLF